MLNTKISKITIDIQWSFISLAITSCTHFLLRIILGKELGPSGLGTYTLIFTIYIIGNQFAAFGLDAALTKYIAEYKNDLQGIRYYVTSGIASALVCGLFSFFLLFVFSEAISINIFHDINVSELLRIIALCYPFMGVQKAILGTLNGLLKIKYYALVNIIQNILIFTFSIIAVINLNTGVKGAVFGLTIPTIFTTLLFLGVLKKYIDISKLMNFSSLKRLVKFGFYVVLTNSVGLINNQIDSLLIGYFMTKVDVGYYAIAIIVMQAVTLLPTSVQTITSPLIASYHHNKEYKKIKLLIKNTLLKTYFITIVISIIIALCGKLLIQIFFSEEFMPAYVPMLILLLGYSISAPMIAVGGALASVGKIEISFQRSVLCMLINIILNFVLIPEFGLIGAAIATSLSLIFACITNLLLLNRYIFCKKESKLNPHKKLILGKPL